jgi:hypothetical protein
MHTIVKPRLDELASPRRNHFFYGKLLDELHLRMEQDYFKGKRWMLNRLALGHGVLCGLKVTKDGKCVRLSPGVAIDAYGREIVVPHEVCIDPSKIAAECGTVRDREPEENHVYLALCYHECKADFVPVLVTDCKPQEECAPSTIVESYCIEVRVGTPPAVDPVTKDLRAALCRALGSSENADQKRERLCELLTKWPCATVSGDACVVLAAIEFAEGGTVGAIDSRPREQVYSNDLLLDLLLCLHGDGQGPQGPKGDPGPPGLGLDPDLPKILDTAWEHNAVYSWLEGREKPGRFPKGFFSDDEGILTTAALNQRIIAGKDVPLFTIYFNRKLAGIDDQTFILRIKYRYTSLQQDQLTPTDFYQELGVCGDILLVDGTIPTPHTQEDSVFAASFIPRKEFFHRLVQLLQVGWQRPSPTQGQPQRELATVTLQVQLKGDFVWASDESGFREGLVLDADNIGGLVGQAGPRSGAVVRGGKNPSGNLTQGGDFEGWFGVTLFAPDRTRPLPTVDPPTTVFSPADIAACPPRVSINLATAPQLTAAGLTAAQAAKVVEARRQSWFVNSQDVAGRAGIPDEVLRNLRDKIIFL